MCGSDANGAHAVRQRDHEVQEPPKLEPEVVADVATHRHPDAAKALHEAVDREETDPEPQSFALVCARRIFERRHRTEQRVIHQEEAKVLDGHHRAVEDYLGLVGGERSDWHGCGVMGEKTV